MKKNKKLKRHTRSILNLRNFFIIISLIFIIFFGFLLRRHDFTTNPRHGATFDEFAWTWLGINLIQNRMPESWSPHPQYKVRKHLTYQGASFWLVKPYLEHPPLFGLVAGVFALSNDTKNMYDVTLSKIRPLALIMGIASVVLMYLFISETYGRLTGLLSAALYATIPSIVVGSRLVQNENFLIPCWLLALYFITKYLKSDKKRFRNLASILAGILSLAKVPWLCVGLSLALILSYRQKFKDAFVVIGVVVGIFIIYFVYGFYLDKSLFIDLMRLQTARYDITYQGLLSIFTKPILIDWYYIDGWILFAWFTVFTLLSTIKKNFLIIIPFIVYLTMYAFAIPDEPGHGWYRYPFNPFLIGSLAIFLVDEFKNITFRYIFFLYIVGFSLLQNGVMEILGFSFLVYRTFIFFSAVPVIFFLWFEKYSRYSRYFILLTLIIFTFFNVLAIFNVRT